MDASGVFGDHDGWRKRVELRSRNDRPLGRYFPELVDAVSALPEEQFVLDVEILVPVDGGYDFAALLARLHPAATRVERLSKRSPATLVARQHCPSRLGALFAAALSDVQSVAGLSPG